MHKNKVPFTHLLLSMLAGSAITFAVYTTMHKNPVAAQSTAQSDSIGNRTNEYNSLRVNGYKHISPLINEEPEYESEKYLSLKKDLTNLIKNEEHDGQISSASVYLNDFSQNEWMTINGDEKYNVGSMVKSCVLIAYLRMAEANPGLLEKEMMFQISKGYILPKSQFVKDTTLVAGKKYKVKELLEFMMAYADSRTIFFLEKNMNEEMFKRIFPDLELKGPNADYQQYYSTPKEYSTIMKALYNASYLSIPYSEYATSLMAKSTFKEGVVKMLPSTQKVAHNFGEMISGNTNELHESSIIYLNNQPYQLIIMTRGSDLKKQSGIMSQISKMVYDKMAANLNS